MRAPKRLLGLLASIPLLGAALAGPAAAPAAAEGCPNELFRTGPSAALAECRAYEQVNPLYKGSATVTSTNVAPDGGSVLYGAKGVPFAEAEAASSSGGTAYSGTRTAGGWATNAIIPPASAYTSVDGTPLAASTDFSSQIFRVAKQGDGSGDTYYYLRRPSGALINTTPPGAPPDAATESKFQSSILGSSGDLSRLVINVATSPYLFRHAEFPIPGDPTTLGGSDLESISGVGTNSPESHLVGVSGGLGSVAALSQCGIDLGSGGSRGGAISSGTRFNAVSEDASTIYFTPVVENQGFVPPCSGPPTTQVYARIDDERTVHISAPQCAPSAPGFAECQSAPTVNANYEGASGDGSKAFFTTTGQLTDDGVQDENSGDTAVDEGQSGCSHTHGDVGCSLYEYDAAEPAGSELRLISAGTPHPQVQGVVRISQDGSHVYFVAQGILTSGANAEGKTPTEGSNNLYVFERDSAHPEGRTSFIATLADTARLEVVEEFNHKPEGALWSADLDTDSYHEAQTTPDGRYLIFASFARLTADDTDNATDIYRYDSQSEELTRISVGHGGFGGNGNGNGEGFDATIPAPQYASGGPLEYQHPPRAISDDGQTVVFETPEALQAGDPNGVTDIYEWHQGTVSMVSNGQTSRGAGAQTATTFLSMSTSGRDIFFVDPVPLTPEGSDGVQDLYDARIDGGFPAALNLTPCTGEACHGALSPAPIPQFPGSAAAVGSEVTQGHLPRKKHKHHRKTNHHRHASNHRRMSR
jgi:hypothetical protein